MDFPVRIDGETHWVGVNDRETDLFESLWPLPRGVSYNSYLISDEKTVLVDTVKKVAFERYLDQVRSLLPPGKSIDYLVINHLEPDHSGSVRLAREAFPGLQIVGNKRTAEFLAHLYGITDGVKVVGDGEELDLGRHKLRFYLTPMVHWPETMMTYVPSSGILFSGDAFGGFGALDGSIFDDEVDVDYYDDEILRYFSNIVAKYSPVVQKAIAKLKGLDIRTICPSHGPVWRKSPARIVGDYDRWSRYEGEPGVVIAYASMYSHTTEMMEAVARGIAQEQCCTLRVHDVARTHVSYVIRDAWRYRALIVGGPTYDTGLFPRMSYLIRLLEEKRLKRRIIGVFGTYGWSGGGVATLREFAKREDFELVGPVVEARFSPTPEDLDNCVLLGRNVVKRLRAARGGAQQ